MIAIIWVAIGLKIMVRLPIIYPSNNVGLDRSNKMDIISIDSEEKIISRMS